MHHEHEHEHEHEPHAIVKPGPGQKVLLHHHERVEIKETEDDWICNDKGCIPVNHHGQTHSSSQGGIVSRLKHFFLGDEGYESDELSYQRRHHRRPSEWASDNYDQLEHSAATRARKLKQGAEDLKDESQGFFDRILHGARQTKEDVEDDIHTAHDKLLDKAGYNAKQRLQHEKDKAGRYSEEAKLKAEKLARDAREKLEQGRDKAEAEYETLKTEYEKGKDKVGEEFEAAKDQAKVKMEDARSRLDEARHALTDHIERARLRIKEGIHAVEETAEDMAERAKQSLGNAAQTVRDAADAGRERIQTSYDNVREGVQDTAHQIKGSVEHARDSVKDRADRIHDNIVDKYKDVKDDVKDGYHHVQSGVKGVLYKAEQAAECLGCVGPNKRGGAYYAGHPTGGHYTSRYGPGPGGLYPAIGISANPVPVTAFYTALSALWFLVLARRVWSSRNHARVYIGDGSAELSREINRDVVVSSTTTTGTRTEKTTAMLHTENGPAIHRYLTLMRAIDARTTFTSTVPLFLTLLSAMELSGAYRPLLHLLSLALLIGNILQTECGIFAADGMGRFRPMGLAINWSVLLFSAIMAIYSALSCNGCPAV
ncbi:hypothetical protein DFS34DRAFT_638448 [Phlyctochytrium arcticum]|nr:hypothetical protein DFS34DRAFT_638448 [Phlyctochytrium arcticum]